MQAYDNLAIEYFYQGDIAKAKVYQERLTRGKVETKDSVIRNVCLDTLMAKRDRIHTGKKKVILKK